MLQLYNLEGSASGLIFQRPDNKLKEYHDFLYSIDFMFKKYNYVWNNNRTKYNKLTDHKNQQKQQIDRLK
jgi:hypothetical protein